MICIANTICICVRACVKSGSHSHDFTVNHRRLDSRGMVGSSVVYCRRCCRALSSVVAWFVVALFGRLLVLKCSKLSGDHRRPKFLSSVVEGQL